MIFGAVKPDAMNIFCARDCMKKIIDFTDVIKYSYLKKKGGIERVWEAKNAFANGRRAERNAGNG